LRMDSMFLPFRRLGVPPPMNMVSNFQLETSTVQVSISFTIALINLGMEFSRSVIE